MNTLLSEPFLTVAAGALLVIVGLIPELILAAALGAGWHTRQASRVAVAVLYLLAVGLTATMEPRVSGSLLIAAAVLCVWGIAAWRRTPGPRPAFWTAALKIVGALGVAALIVAGLDLTDHSVKTAERVLVGAALMLIAFAWLARGSVRGVMRDIRGRLTLAETLAGAGARGFWGFPDAGVRVVLWMAGGRLQVSVALPGWPETLAVQPRPYEPNRPGTGDAAFDAELRFRGKPHLRRLMSTPAIRRALMDVCRMGATIERDATLRLTLSDPRVDDVVQFLDGAAALAAHVAEAMQTGPASVFDSLADEPSAAARRSGYEWLVARNWQVPAVLRHAANDPDAAIRAWAEAQIPEPTAVFR